MVGASEPTLMPLSLHQVPVAESNRDDSIDSIRNRIGATVRSLSSGGITDRSANPTHLGIDSVAHRVIVRWWRLVDGTVGVKGGLLALFVRSLVMPMLIRAFSLFVCAIFYVLHPCCKRGSSSYSTYVGVYETPRQWMDHCRYGYPQV